MIRARAEPLVLLELPRVRPPVVLRLLPSSLPAGRLEGVRPVALSDPELAEFKATTDTIERLLRPPS